MIIIRMKAEMSRLYLVFITTLISSLLFVSSTLGNNSDSDFMRDLKGFLVTVESNDSIKYYNYIRDSYKTKLKEEHNISTAIEYSEKFGVKYEGLDITKIKFGEVVFIDIASNFTRYALILAEKSFEGLDYKFIIRLKFVKEDSGWKIAELEDLEIGHIKKDLIIKITP